MLREAEMSYCEKVPTELEDLSWREHKSLDSPAFLRIIIFFGMRWSERLPGEAELGGPLNDE